MTQIPDPPPPGARRSPAVPRRPAAPQPQAPIQVTPAPAYPPQAPAPPPYPQQPPVQVNVEQAPASGRLDPVVLVELAYKYGISVVFACVLLGALLYYANRLDERSQDNAHALTLIEKHISDVRILQSAMQQDLARLGGRPLPSATAYPGLTE